AAVRAVPASRWTARERGGSVALGGSVEGGVVARLVDARPSLPVAAEQLVVGGAGPDRLGHHGSGDAVGAGREGGQQLAAAGEVDDLGPPLLGGGLRAEHQQGHLVVPDDLGDVVEEGAQG